MARVCGFLVLVAVALPAWSDDAPSSADDQATIRKELRPLAWMIGTWIDAGAESTIETTCQWTKNNNFMMRSFRVKIADRVEMDGTQVIGYDAAAKKIRSWVFDSEGGIGQGQWQRDGNRWIVKSSHVLRSGARGSSVNVFTYVDEHTYTWQSMGREMDGEILPDIEPVTIVRQ